MIPARPRSDSSVMSTRPPRYVSMARRDPFAAEVGHEAVDSDSPEIGGTGTDRTASRTIADDDSLFEADIDRLGTAGVTKGCNTPDNTRLCPTGNITRGQLAASLRRALG